MPPLKHSKLNTLQLKLNHLTHKFGALVDVVVLLGDYYNFDQYSFESSRMKIGLSLKY